MIPKIPDFKLKKFKAFLKRSKRKKVPSPYEGDEPVKVLAVTREGWSFRSKTKGVCGMRFDSIFEEEIDRVLS